jgi:hypothetical protein
LEFMDSHCRLFCLKLRKLDKVELSSTLSIYVAYYVA